MLILYTKNNCPFCEKAKKAFLERGVGYEERNIGDDAYFEEAKEKGIKSVPYLVDTTANLTMADSERIIDYISECAF